MYISSHANWSSADIYDRATWVGRFVIKVTYASGGIEEGDISEVGAVEAHVARVFHLTLRARYHTALYSPLPGVRVPFGI